MKLKVMSAILSLLLTSFAYAEIQNNGFNGEAILATAVAHPKEATIKGITWRCEAANCTATADKSPGLDSFAKQCKTVARELGALAKFRSGGRTATKSELDTCNQAAVKS